MESLVDVLIQLLDKVDEFDIVDPMVIEYHQTGDHKVMAGGSVMMIEGKLAISNECVPGLF